MFFDRSWLPAPKGLCFGITEAAVVVVVVVVVVVLEASFFAYELQPLPSNQVNPIEDQAKDDELEISECCQRCSLTAGILNPPAATWDIRISRWGVP